MKPKLLFLFLFLTANWLTASDFIEQQKRYKNVRTAFDDKNKKLIADLKSYGLNTDLDILIVAFKSEKILDLYAKKKTDTVYTKIKSYRICASSGSLGPKRKQGDKQVPEGLYHIDRFNPASNYFLSLGVNYPNKSDRIKSNAANLGGDIFIHGSCVTVGCLPMTDDKIKEIYLYALYAKNSGQNTIPIYIFPYKMTKENHEKYQKKYSTNQDLISFWNNIKKAYDTFEKDKKQLNFSINQYGDYIIKP